MRAILCAGVAIASIFFALSASRVARADDAKAASILAEIGRGTFQRYCSSCHGAEGKGDGPIAKVLRTPPADLTLIAKRRGGTFADDEVSKFIDGRNDIAAHGPRDMPVWGRRFAQRIAEDTTEDEVARGQLLLLVEYLKSIQK